jgi:hypothetical protein
MRRKIKKEENDDFGLPLNSSKSLFLQLRPCEPTRHVLEFHGTHQFFENFQNP